MIFSFARRPENRRRPELPEAERRPWADTEPQCFRSEAFAEDLAAAAEQLRPSPPPPLAFLRLLRQA